MALTFKSVGKAIVKGAKKAFTGAKKVASQANPLFGAGYDALGGTSAKGVGQNYLDRSTTNAKVAGTVLPIALTAGAAVPALGSAMGMGGAGMAGAAGAAGAASKMGTLGKIAGSPLTPALLEFGGSVLSGIGQGRQASSDRREEGRQFDLNYGLQKREVDAAEEERQRRLAAGQSMSPMRQQVMQMLAQRLGVNPASLGSMGAPPPSMGVTPSLQPPAAAPAGGAPRPSPDQLQAILQRMRQVF